MEGEVAAAAAEEGAVPVPWPDEPEVFETVLPITVLEVSDDDFMESECEGHTALDEDGCLISQAKEDRK
ncbi:hypothetical protein JRQ81_001746 [Phrynocephalus forsythii]|uniref:Uncharacterized protein n=1 Tax=Phrynocephalus forsythii TaxID=171643 RepID=A0A9Q1B9M3_9SAUR|nr:hypothetical protein JRQ81_001746 [Phrynocephalus forsythii]